LFSSYAFEGGEKYMSAARYLSRLIALYPSPKKKKATKALCNFRGLWREKRIE